MRPFQAGKTQTLRQGLRSGSVDRPPKLGAAQYNHSRQSSMVSSHFYSGRLTSVSSVRTLSLTRQSHRAPFTDTARSCYVTVVLLPRQPRALTSHPCTILPFKADLFVLLPSLVTLFPSSTVVIISQGVDLDSDPQASLINCDTKLNYITDLLLTDLTSSSLNTPECQCILSSQRSDVIT